MFEFSIFPEEVLKTEAALYGCAACPEKPWCPGSIPEEDGDW
jgi:hypothetical protein